MKFSRHRGQGDQPRHTRIPNISDNILVYGKNQKEHDQNFEILFMKAREKKITG